MGTVKGAFTIRFIRNGDQIFITRNIVRVENGVEYGASLFQAIDPTSGALSVDWTEEENQPIIKLEVNSSKGYNVSMDKVSWAYDGNNIVFGTSTDSDGWYTSNDSRFKRKMSDGIEKFKIVKNLASSSDSVVSNKQITYTVTYTSNAIQDSIVSSVDVQIQQAGTDSHSVNIVTKNVELSKDVVSTVLTAECMYGIKMVNVGSNGYTMKWYQDGTELGGQTDKTLTVTRDMVEGGSIFTAKLFKDGNLVAQDGQRVNDTADEWQIKTSVPSGCYDFVDLGHNGTVKFNVYKNGVEQSGVSDSSFSWVTVNSLGVQTGSGTGSTLVITAEMAKCTNSSGQVYYGDVDYECTVTI